MLTRGTVSRFIIKGGVTFSGVVKDIRQNHCGEFILIENTTQPLKAGWYNREDILAVGGSAC